MLFWGPLCFSEKSILCDGDSCGAAVGRSPVGLVPICVWSFRFIRSKDGLRAGTLNVSCKGFPGSSRPSFRSSRQGVCRASAPCSRHRTPAMASPWRLPVGMGASGGGPDAGEGRFFRREGREAVPFAGTDFPAACGRSQKEAEGRERFGIYRYLCPEGRGLLPRPVAEPFGGTAFKFHSECSSKRS